MLRGRIRAPMVRVRCSVVLPLPALTAASDRGMHEDQPLVRRFPLANAAINVGSEATC